MIHLNLIDAAERESMMDAVNPVRVTNVSDQVKGSRKKAATAGLAALFVFVGFSCFISVFGVPQPLEGILPAPYLDLIGAEDASRSALALGSGRTTSAGGSLEAQAAAANEAAKHRSNLTVGQIVGEVNPQVLFNNKRVDYNSFLPMEQISFQRASMNQFFKFLNTATPEDVGFSDCIYQAPNFFYVRGVAAKPTSQRSFLDRIKSMSANFKTPPLPENAPATDITAFGQFNVTNVNMNAVNSFVKSGELAEELKSFKALAASNKVSFSGLEKPVVEDLGVYKRYSYTVLVNSEFQEFQSFMEAFAASPIRVGISKVEMKLAKRNMQTVMHAILYVVP